MGQRTQHLQQGSATPFASAVGSNSLLARAVVAAEDQRFFEHTGYDIVEVAHALRSNNQRAVRAAPVKPP